MTAYVGKPESSNRFENAVMWSMMRELVTLNLTEISLAGGGKLSSDISGPVSWTGE